MLDGLVRALLRPLPVALRRRLSFAWRYRRGATPWDTGQTPPEVVAWVAAQPPGRALDLGCGTGTNVLFLARHGWQATGVDYVAQAVARAQARAEAEGLACRFFQGDVTRLDLLPLDAPFDLLLDVGCLHSLTEAEQAPYAHHAARLTRPGGWFLLYASQPHGCTPGLGPVGLTPAQVGARFAPHFHVARQELGHDTQRGWARGWYWLQRTAA